MKMKEYKINKITLTIVLNKKKVQIKTRVNINNTIALITLPYVIKAWTMQAEDKYRPELVETQFMKQTKKRMQTDYTRKHDIKELKTKSV
jgi:hypothetical protein